jgi:hypothetical protein
LRRVGWNFLPLPPNGALAARGKRRTITPRRGYNDCYVDAHTTEQTPMNELPRTAPDGGRPQAQTLTWQSPRGLTRAQLEAAARVMRAHADRLAARREENSVEHVGRPIAH